MVDALAAAAALSPATLSTRARGGAIGHAADGVTIDVVEGRQTASLAAFRGEAPALIARTRTVWDVSLPTTPRQVAGDGIAFSWAGPDRWLVTAPDGPDLEAALREQLGGHAAVTAQGDGRVVLRLGGPHARATLAKLVGIDLHPRAFRSGDTALTLAGHIAVQLWQTDDAPTYEIAAFRSLADSLHHALCEAAAEFHSPVTA